MGTPVREYPVDSDTFLDEETAVQSTPTQQGPSTVSVSPSPFHVPVIVEITASDDDSCVFAFLYPNRELPERPWQSLRDDPNVDVEYGRFTGKILRVRIKSALKRLSQGPPQLRLWTALPKSGAQFRISERNAKIVSNILARMPEAVRREVLMDLRSLVS